jgi:hypothetical protein
MPPAQQRLESGDLIGPDVRLRLVDETQFGTCDGVAKVMLQDSAVAKLRIHRRLEK